MRNKEKERIIAEVNRIWFETIGYEPRRRRKREPYRCVVCGVVLDPKTVGWIHDGNTNKDYCSKCWENRGS